MARPRGLTLLELVNQRILLSKVIRTHTINTPRADLKVNQAKETHHPIHLYLPKRPSRAYLPASILKIDHQSIKEVNLSLAKSDLYTLPLVDWQTPTHLESIRPMRLKKTLRSNRVSSPNLEVITLNTVVRQGNLLKRLQTLQQVLQTPVV